MPLRETLAACVFDLLLQPLAIFDWILDLAEFQVEFPKTIAAPVVTVGKPIRIFGEKLVELRLRDKPPVRSQIAPAVIICGEVFYGLPTAQLLWRAEFSV